MIFRELAHAVAPGLSTRALMHELAGHVWAADAGVVEAVLSDLAAVLPHVRGAAVGERLDGAARPYQVRGRSAVLSMRGLMLPSGPSWLESYGVVLSERMIDRIRAAQTDDAVDEIILEVDSPGGAVLGTQALAETVAGSSKPVVAHVLHMAASAALYVTSQASQIVARPGALIGSIGTYAVLVDASRAAEDAGIKVHVVRAGEHKGVGTPGAPITERQLAEVQSRVDRMNDGFVAAVARGRDLTEARVRELATGATWDAAEAMRLGLVDQLEDMATAQVAPAEENIMAMTEQEKAEFEALRAAAREKDEKLAQLGAEAGKAKAEAARARAEAEAFAATAKAAAADDKLAVINAAAGSADAEIGGRVAPANRKAIEALADHMTAAELRAYLAALPVVTRSQAAGSDGSTAPVRTGAAGTLSAGDQKILKGLGLSMADVQKFGSVRERRADGTLIAQDGTEFRAAAAQEG